MYNILLFIAVLVKYYNKYYSVIKTVTLLVFVYIFELNKFRYCKLKLYSDYHYVWFPSSYIFYFQTYVHTILILKRDITDFTITSVV